MDQIFIKDLPVIAKHGVLKEENVLGQKFLVSAVLYTDFSKAVINDSIEDTVNYTQICKLIKEFMTKNTFALIETCAGRLALEIMMKYLSVNKVEIEIKKPWAPVGIDVDMISVKTKLERHKVYLSLGSNMGDREANLNQAIKLLGTDETTQVIKISNFIETEPYGYVEQPAFLNCAVEINTILEPRELLEFINDIESELKRERLIHWGPRTIDVDIILYDDLIHYEEDLIIPHKEMHLREFVLEPLTQINPYAINPVCNKCAIELLKELKKS